MAVRLCFICGKQVYAGEPYAVVVFRYFSGTNRNRREAVIAQMCDDHKGAEVEIKEVKEVE